MKPGWPSKDSSKASIKRGKWVWLTGYIYIYIYIQGFQNRVVSMISMEVWNTQRHNTSSYPGISQDTTMRVTYYVPGCHERIEVWDLRPYAHTHLGAIW